MNYFDLYSSYPDHTIAAAWDSQVKETDNIPWLTDTLTECGGELVSRFAMCYAELRALPRGARRAMQRQLARSSELAAILPEYLQQGGRRLQHRMAWSLAGAALLLALGQGVGTAATITVTTNNPNIASDGQCSLIESIVNANNDAATHPDCLAGSGADTIVLPANANMTLSNAAGVTQYGSPVGLPLITSRITIEGNGATIHRQANAPDFGLMAVRNSGDLTLQSVILSGGSSRNGGGVSNSGKLSIQSSIISGNVGRGISNFGGSLTIATSAIVGNTAGGIYSSYGVLTLENSTISGNTANYFGGGVSSSGGTIAIANSTISDNSTQGFGGGLSHGIGYGDPGLITIANSTISGNTAKNGGGGVSNYGETIAIVNSTISNNVTQGWGGGLSNGIGYGGPGLFTIANSTISGNRANEGGGVFNRAAVTHNHSLTAGNEAASGREIANQSNNFTANNFNLFGSNGNAGVTGFTPGPTDIVPGVALAQILGPLKFNGGPTQTHALVPGSPAIDAGNPGGCRNNLGSLLLKDQRGFARNIDGNNDGTARCDIGAVEFGAGSATLVDFDGDGLSDIGVYRNGVWFIRRSFDGGVTAEEWGGLPQDKPVPAEYDGDGKVDHAVYRDGTWFILRSSDGGQTTVAWGGVSTDVPVPADYDGDGKADIAVYRDGVWFIIRSSDDGIRAIGWGGLPQDIPLPADYDGDGKADIAIYRDGTWFILRSSDSGVTTVDWGGVLADIPVPADYDGDGKADIAVYRDGTWFIVRSSDNGQTGVGWGGLPQDIPVPADFDGDGKIDIAVYRDGTWFVHGGVTATGWGGAPEDIPLNGKKTLE